MDNPVVDNWVDSAVMDPIDDVATPFLLISAFHGLVDAVHEELAAEGLHGVRVSHGFAMQAIGQGCTSVQLGERLGVSKQAATKTARTLEDLGLVTRTANERDRRERLITPTDRGHQMLRRSAVAFRAQLRLWREKVGDERVDATLATLAAVSGNNTLTDLSEWAP